MRTNECLDYLMLVVLTLSLSPSPSLSLSLSLSLDVRLDITNVIVSDDYSQLLLTLSLNGYRGNADILIAVQPKIFTEEHKGEEGK